jgi:hypothetical protein
MSTAAPPLAPDLLAGLRRLKLSTIRAQAPEVLQTARTQRWPPEDVLRTLVAAEIAARDQTNQHLRLKAANLPLLKRLDDFDTLAAGIPAATFAYVASLEWIRARENTLLVGPAGTGKSHVLIGVGLRAVEQGLRVRYGTAADLVEQLYRGLADGDVDLSQLAGALESQWNAAGIGDGASRGNSDLQRAGRHRRSRIGQRLLRIRQRIREEGDIGTGDDDGRRETYQQEAIGKGRSGSRYYGCHGDLSLGRSACPGNRALE